MRVISQRKRERVHRILKSTPKVDTELRAARKQRIEYRKQLVLSVLGIYS